MSTMTLGDGFADFLSTFHQDITPPIDYLENDATAGASFETFVDDINAGASVVKNTATEVILSGDGYFVVIDGTGLSPSAGAESATFRHYLGNSSGTLTGAKVYLGGSLNGGAVTGGTLIFNGTFSASADTFTVGDREVVVDGTNLPATLGAWQSLFDLNYAGAAFRVSDLKYYDHGVLTSELDIPTDPLTSALNDYQALAKATIDILAGPFTPLQLSATQLVFDNPKGIFVISGTGLGYSGSMTDPIDFNDITGTVTSALLNEGGSYNSGTHAVTGGTTAAQITFTAAKIAITSGNFEFDLDSANLPTNFATLMQIVNGTYAGPDIALSDLKILKGGTQAVSIVVTTHQLTATFLGYTMTFAGTFDTSASAAVIDGNAQPSFLATSLIVTEIASGQHPTPHTVFSIPSFSGPVNLFDGSALFDIIDSVTAVTAAGASNAFTLTLNPFGGVGIDGVNYNTDTLITTLIGGTGADTFLVDPADLTSAITIDGGGTQGDILQFTAAGTVAAGAFAHVSHIEQITLANGTNNIALSNSLVASSDSSAVLTVLGGTGNDTIDASAVSSASAAVRLFAGSGNDTLRGGAGADTFNFATANLTAADTVNGGGGAADILQFTTAGTVAASAFANVSHIEQVTLANGTNSVALGDAAVGLSDNNHLLIVTGGTGNDTIDASAVTTTTNRVFFLSGSGADTLTGGLGGDVFNFTAADLSSADTVNGGAGATVGQADRLTFTTAGTIAASAFLHVSHIETMTLANGTNSVTLTDALVALADDGHVLSVIGGTGNDTIDASAVTGGNFVYVTSGAGNDVLTGGAGTDSFLFAAIDLTSADTVNGGLGTDTLLMTTAGTLAASAFTGVTHVEQIVLANGTNSVTLTDAMVASSDLTHLMAVSGGTGNDTINGSAVTTTSNRLYYVAGSGNDALTGGLGSDFFNFAAADLTAADTVNGGGGIFGDRLTFTTAGTVAAGAFAGVSHIEAVTLAAGGNSIALNDALVGSSDAGHALTINGGAGNDTVDASGVASAANTLNILGGSGSDTLTGGAGADTINFAAADLTSADFVNGGAGNDTLLFSTVGTVAAAAFAHVTHVEAITLSNGSNSIALADAMVGASDSSHLMVINGGSGADTIDASAVITAANRVFFVGGDGADTMTAGAGGDIFSYSLASNSTGTAFDTIVGMNFASDHFDTPGGPGTITVDGARAGVLNNANFTADLTTAFAGLAGHHAGLFTASSGNLSGQTYLVVDLNGAAGYQSGGDLLIHMVASTGTLVAGDFV